MRELSLTQTDFVAGGIPVVELDRVIPVVELDQVIPVVELNSLIPVVEL